MLFASIFTIRNKNNINLNNNARITLNNAIYKLHQKDFSDISNYKYTILDLKGTVIKSNNPNYLEGSTTSLDSLSTLTLYRDNNSSIYMAPYIVNELQNGTIYIEIGNSDILNPSFLSYLPFIILAIFIIGFSLYTYKMIVKDILLPINNLHTITNNIIKGDVITSLNYDYDGEIGTLCHDFEQLRESISFRLGNEKKLKEKEKLLLAYISHDLKTPLATISGYAEGIYTGIANDKEKIKEYSSIILSKTTMLTRLIEDILEHSKTKLNELSITLQETYSLHFFSKLLDEFKTEVEGKNLSFSYSDIPNILISIDKNRIKQVMENLISNAIKFSRENGEISVDFTLYENNLLISVKDNGMGILASDLPMIYTEFFRGEKSRSQNIPGSGLGLNIVKYIVEKHGGQIECDSIHNIGTTFTFSLPFN